MRLGGALSHDRKGVGASFNSSLVRLGVHKILKIKHLNSVVSIPAWCDWETEPEDEVSESCGVSIPAWCDWEDFEDILTREGVVGFNSSLVRLGAVLIKFTNTAGSSFNSSLVRLGVNASLIIKDLGLEFQFQLGAIGRLQPHLPILPSRSFNSSLVRLGVPYAPQPARLYIEFQFQLGAIGSRSRARMRFEGLRVSIPAWCDWEQSKYFSHHRHFAVSIPAWCDWETYPAR